MASWEKFQLAKVMAGETPALPARGWPIYEFMIDGA
jgi:hypothetical protein